MDFSDHISQLANRVEKLKPQLLTEEATKNALIMPFIQALGYDVFNPSEVIPEFTSDVGIKKGEKVDYAIVQANRIVILIECKGVNDKLTNHDTQLIRYFHTCEAKFAILTNGQIFKFFTDLDDNNRLDDKPFFELDLLNIKEQQVAELKKFHKTNFDVEKIISTASELKYLNAIKIILNQEAEEPSESFIRFFTSQVYAGKATAKVLEQFKEIVKKSVNQWLSDKVSSRLKSALEKESENDKAEAKKIGESMDSEDEKNNIVTTQEEIDGFTIVKSILRTKGEISKILYKDNQNYFAIFYDKQTQPVCRLHFNRAQKYIGLLDEMKKEERIPIETLDDIFQYSDRLLRTLENYIG
ncbi:type I restriction endonuclease [Alkaliflexus imshenetskii]|uniref:type I restriction endonuclease n=1 Tax=Alkaliflexus imshenetskii TaxID=286730 RepID=UPI00047D8230|nr:type I restriction enzyme HsdR N-terminal domain-containing protein [Alkaliflexus imshenetskii]